MKYFVVSDTHSYYTILKATLDQKGFSPDKDHVLVLLGDAFDRGDGTADLAEFLLSLHDRGKLIYIRGNHEDLLVKALWQLARGADPLDIALSYHATNGTWQTLLDLAGLTESQAIAYPQTLIANVMASRVYRDLLPSCANYFELGRYVFVHGYIPCTITESESGTTYAYNPNWRDASPSEWADAHWYKGVEIAVEHGIWEPDQVIVCGHWHASAFHSKYEHRGSEGGPDADHSPYYNEQAGIIGIDGRTAISQSINCLVFDEGGNLLK